MQTSIMALPASGTLDAFAKTVLEHPKQSHFLVHEGDRIVGLVGREAAVGALGSTALGDRHSAKVANTHFVVVPAETMLADLLGKMFAKGASIALVAADTKAPSIADIQGVITEHETADAMIRSVDLFCD